MVQDHRTESCLGGFYVDKNCEICSNLLNEHDSTIGSTPSAVLRLIADHAIRTWAVPVIQQLLDQVQFRTPRRKCPLVRSSNTEALICAKL